MINNKLQIGDIVDNTCRQVSKIPFQLLKIDSDNKLRQLEPSDLNPLKGFDSINLIDPSAPNSLDNIKAAFLNKRLRICNPDFGKKGYPLELWLQLTARYVQSATVSLGEGFNYSVGYNHDVKKGSLLIAAIVVWGWADGDPLPTTSISDTLGNSYTLAHSATQPSGPGVLGVTAYLYYAISNNDGPCTVTVSPGINVVRYLTVLEYSGPWAISPLISADGNYGSDPSGNVTTGALSAISGDLGIAFFVGENAGITITTSGLTTRIFDSGPGDFIRRIADKDMVSSEAFTAQWSLHPMVSSWTLGASFRPR